MVNASYIIEIRYIVMKILGVMKHWKLKNKKYMIQMIKFS